MALIDQKTKVFGNIAALTTLTQGFPKLSTSSSLASINNKGNSIMFLTDLLKALVGFEILVSTVVDTLTYGLKDIELEIKTALKQSLKSIVSCGVDPSIPAFMKSTGAGIVLPVNKIDFTDLFLVNPSTNVGNNLYNDVTPVLTNSTDLNTFMFGAIQANNTVKSWGSLTPIGQNILNFKFVAQGSGNIPNNTFTITANSNYDSKTLTDLNNDFVDSLTLFNTQNIISRILDIIYGSISFYKTKKQLENEGKINSIVESILNSDSDDVIDDGWFVFTNPEIARIQEEADNRKNGVLKLQCCNQITASVPISFLTEMNSAITGATDVIEQKEAITANLTSIANQNTLNSTNPSDNITIKLNFIQEIINNITKTIVNIVLSPKVVTIFALNYRIIYGQNATFKDGVDFIKQNRTLIIDIMKRISFMILKVLLALALKQIASLVAQAEAKKLIEKSKSNLSQLLSLIGIPQETLRIIQGLT